jgi:hypothetical protein
LSIVAVIGPQGAGKTTFAKALAKALGTRVADTSTSLSLIVDERRKILREPPIDWRDPEVKEHYRQELVSMADAIKLVEPLTLIRAAMRKGRVVSGIRATSELDAAIAERLIVMVFYISRPGVEPSAKDNFDIMPDRFHEISNEGSLEDLEVVAKSCAKKAREHGFYNEDSKVSIVWSREDADNVCSNLHGRELTDEEWEAVEMHWSWRKGLSEILIERGHEIITDVVHEVVKDE